MVLPSRLQQLPLDDYIENKKETNDNNTPQSNKEKPDITAITSLSPDYYRPPNPEDQYIPPGRKYFDRDELMAPIDDIKVGPPIIQNDGLYRQQFAIQDFGRQIRSNIMKSDVNSKVGPQHTLKPSIKNSFYIKEQRYLDPDFVEPDDPSLKYKETGNHLIDYMKIYKENPHYIETDDAVNKAIRDHVNKKVPMPGYARLKVAIVKKLHEFNLDNQKYVDKDKKEKGGSGLKTFYKSSSK